jgi:hypothetical protein
VLCVTQELGPACLGHILSCLFGREGKEGMGLVLGSGTQHSAAGKPSLAIAAAFL